MFRLKAKSSSGRILNDSLRLVFYIYESTWWWLGFKLKHVVIYVFNEARWDIVANEGFLYIFIYNQNYSPERIEEYYEVKMVQKRLRLFFIRFPKSSHTDKKTSNTHFKAVCGVRGKLHKEIFCYVHCHECFRLQERIQLAQGLKKEKQNLRLVTKISV
jgi:hypothetical protein